MNDGGGNSFNTNIPHDSSCHRESNHLPNPVYYTDRVSVFLYPFFYTQLS